MNDVKDGLSKPSKLLNILHLYTLSGFVIAFPLYSFLAANPSYFVTNDIWPGTIYFLVLTLSVFLPTVFVVFTIPFLVAGSIRDSMHWLIHRLIIVVLLSLSFMQNLRGISFLPAVLIVLLAIVIAIFATKHYSTNTFIYIGFAFLSPLAVFFPIQFLMNTDISQILNQTNAIAAQETSIGIDEKPPIVFVVFDEFPLIDLLNAQGDIDAKRYPNFAGFADGATWYANATTVHDYTLKAVPAILSGNYPVNEPVIPIRQNYPKTLFTLLENHYMFHSYEAITRLSNDIRYTQYEIQDAAVQFQLALDCSVMYVHTTLPKNLANRIAPMEFGLWGGFMNKFLNYGPSGAIFEGVARMGGALPENGSDSIQPNSEIRDEIDEYFKSIGDFPDETFHFLHILIPHTPTIFLPSGTTYNYRDYGPIHESTDAVDVHLNAVHRRQAHLLQVGFADTLLGELVGILNAEDLYAKSLIVLVADHGVNYNGPDHRTLTEDNIGSVGFVPLFIKYPHQSEGKIDRTNVQTIDIAPTLSDVLSLEGGHAMQGRSLIDPDAAIPKTKRLTNILNEVFEKTKTEYTAIRSEELADYVERFTLDHPKATLYNFGPGLDWLGQSREALGAAALPATITCPVLDDLNTVDLSASYIPARLSGTIETAGVDDAILVACVNGVAQGVTEPYETAEGLQFELILSDTVLLEGNEIELFLLPRP